MINFEKGSFFSEKNHNDDNNISEVGMCLT